MAVLHSQSKCSVKTSGLPAGFSCSLTVAASTHTKESGLSDGLMSSCPTYDCVCLDNRRGEGALLGRSW